MELDDDKDGEEDVKDEKQEEEKEDKEQEAEIIPSNKPDDKPPRKFEQILFFFYKLIVIIAIFIVSLCYMPWPSSVIFSWILVWTSSDKRRIVQVADSKMVKLGQTVNEEPAEGSNSALTKEDPAIAADDAPKGMVSFTVGVSECYSEWVVLSWRYKLWH